MSKIIGNPTVTPPPKPDWNQTDFSKGDYIKNKPNVANALQVTERGNPLNLTDISPIKHDIKVSLKSKNKIPTSALDYKNWINMPQGSNNYHFYPIELEVGKTYCFSGRSNSTTGEYGYFYLIKSNDDFATNTNVIQLFRNQTYNNGKTFVAEEGYKYGLYCYAAYTYLSQYYDLMIEEGTSITTYTPYVDDLSKYGVTVFDNDSHQNGKSIFADSNGIVSGVTSHYPMTVLTIALKGTASSNSVTLEAVYNRDIVKAFEELKNAIISLGGNV